MSVEKISLSALNLQPMQDEWITATLDTGAGEVEIKVRKYLPVQEKLEIIGQVISAAADANNFKNPVKIDVYASLYIVFNYTNIEFTEEELSDLPALYDLLESNNFFAHLYGYIDESELNYIFDGIDKCAEAVYAYRNSVLGIMQQIQEDYNGLNLDLTKIQEAMKDPENVGFLKEVLTKLG